MILVRVVGVAVFAKSRNVEKYLVPPKVNDTHHTNSANPTQALHQRSGPVIHYRTLLAKATNGVRSEHAVVRLNVILHLNALPSLDRAAVASNFNQRNAKDSQ